MEGYSSLFTSGLMPRTPPRAVVNHTRIQHGDGSRPRVPPIITTAPTPEHPSKLKSGRKRRSSFTLATNPVAALKSPTRNARSALLSPVRENRRFFDLFGNRSIGTAMNMLRSSRQNISAAPKPIPSAPLPSLPAPSSTPSTPRRRGSRASAHPPSSPTVPDVQPLFSSRKMIGAVKRQADRVLLRLTTSDTIQRNPLTPSSLSNASTPTSSTPELAFSSGATSFYGWSALSTPITGANYFDKPMDEVKEECEENQEETDVDMMI